MSLRLPDSWVWDSWYAVEGELHHAFYLRASRALGDPDRRHRHPYVGHAVSADLTSWSVVQDAIAVSEPPAFDDWTTWTGSVVRDPAGGWRMFYTGSSHADDGLVQRIGWATSPDLVTWSKARSAPLEADPRWYEKLDLTRWHDEAWRDPFVFRADDGRWHMYVTARSSHGDPRGRGVIGHCTSSDLDHWVVEPPLTSPGSGFGQMEVPQVEVVDGVPTLIFSCGWAELGDERRDRHGAGGLFSVNGPSILGPFDISAARRFDHDSIYAGRLVQHAGRWHMIGFRDIEAGEFVGELSDPIAVTSEVGLGLTRVGRDREPDVPGPVRRP
jgi:beta-fructofuranosidase